MRSRTVREGSVGLLILLGLGLFVGGVLWLRGVQLGRRSYTAIVSFADVGGMQEGAIVRYRGVNVGNIIAIRPGANGVEVEIEISPADIIIPRSVLVEANQSGLISEVSVDITPQKQLPTGLVVAKPLDEDCDPDLIVCNGSRLQGQVGVSIDALIRSSTRFASVYSNPELYANVDSAVKNAANAAAGVAQLSRELAILSRSTRQQLGTFSATATSVQQAANQVSNSATKTVDRFGTTADQLSLTATQVNRLVTNIDDLVTTNRSSLVTALNNINRASEQLEVTVGGLSPTIDRVTQGELLQNLETLSANAAQASANLRDASNALNNPSNILVLQQTLDSARATFENAQKITADLDELTGDPRFRQNIREIVDGLSGLVSSTEQLDQQMQLAQTLRAIRDEQKQPKVASDAETPTVPTLNIAEFSTANLDSAEFSLAGKTIKAIAPSVTIKQEIKQEDKKELEK